MSWDVVLMSVPPEITENSKLEGDFSSPLGTASAVLPLLKQIVPSLDLSDPTWGILDGPDFSIEFNIGKEDPIPTIMLHVRGGEAALGPIQRLCEETGWRALDCGDGEFIDFAGDPGAGLRKWQIYRDQMTALYQDQGSSVVADPKLPGVRVDAIASPASKPRKWWRFWK